MKPKSDRSTETLYGIHPVQEALAAGRRTIHRIHLVQDKQNQRFNPIIDIAQKRKIPLQWVSRSTLTSQCRTDLHQGIGATVSSYPFVELSRLIPGQGTMGDRQCFLMVDSVEDPQNLGALVRTALCSGIDGIIIPKDRAASPTPAASKASAGALEHARICQVTNLAATIQLFQKNGVWIYGTAMDADASLFATRIAFPAAIVIGSEGKGIRPLVLKNCDFLVAIPQSGPVSSLNASAAGAVVMYEFFRQRSKVL